MRKIVLMAALSLMFAAGCGGEELTNEDVKAMSEEDSLAMLDCQMRKAAEDLGQEEAVDRYAEELMGTVEEDGDLLQVILHNDGYRCPEYLP